MIVQDAAVLEVADLDRRIHAGHRRESHQRTILAPCGDLHLHARLEVPRQAFDVKHLAPREPQRIGRLPRLVLERKHAHSHQIGAVDALVALSDNCLHAQQQRALGRPVA